MEHNVYHELEKIRKLISAKHYSEAIGDISTIVEGAIIEACEKNAGARESLENLKKKKPGLGTLIGIARGHGLLGEKEHSILTELNDLRNKNSAHYAKEKTKLDKQRLDRLYVSIIKILEHLNSEFDTGKAGLCEICLDDYAGSHKKLVICNECSRLSRWMAEFEKNLSRKIHSDIVQIYIKAGFLQKSMSNASASYQKLKEYRNAQKKELIEELVRNQKLSQDLQDLETISTLDESKLQSEGLPENEREKMKEIQKCDKKLSEMREEIERQNPMVDESFKRLVSVFSKLDNVAISVYVDNLAEEYCDDDIKIPKNKPLDYMGKILQEDGFTFYSRGVIPQSLRAQSIIENKIERLCSLGFSKKLPALYACSQYLDNIIAIIKEKEKYEVSKTEARELVEDEESILFQIKEDLENVGFVQSLIDAL